MRTKIKYPAMILAAAAVLAVAAGIAAAWMVPLPERLAAPASAMVEYADGSPMCVFLSPDDKWRIPVTLSEVDPHYLKALIQFEDSRFYHHPGVDPLAIARAAVQDLYARRVVSGASTITMQLVRILEPRPRTLRSKCIEALRALQLEVRFPKRRILEYYLEFAPYGKNLEGIEAASLAYFGHRCRELSPFEIAYLLSVPQDPTSRYPSPRHAQFMPRVVAHVSHVLRDDGVFNKEQYREASTSAVPDSLRPFPREAMHAAFFLEGRAKDGRVRSTIRRNAQFQVEGVLKNYRAQLDSMGIHNGAVVVIDNHSGAVVAAAGNFDFWDADHHGQVVGFNAPRSPGSAMKPFIYALAIDHGLALPDYMVSDAPVYYSGYAPINFDHKFRGLVRLRDALSMSLNIPFVNLTRDIGVDEFLDFLRDAGVNTLVPDPGYYGLSIAIGGMDITLAEIVNLYAMLSRGGFYQEAAWTRDAPASSPRQLLSPGACWLTRQALRLRDRPDFPGRRRVNLSPDIFWKTGTSARFRDAWAIGGNAEYTAGVWLGNFDGASSNYLTGASRSGPVLFDVLEGLGRAGRGPADLPPPDLIKVKICAWSGYLAGRNCPHVKTAYAVRGSLPPGRCPYHVEYLVDRVTGLRADPLCGKALDLVPRVFTVLPAEASRWISALNAEAPAPPPLHPLCTASYAPENPARIIRPRPNAVFFITPGLALDKQEIPLEADASGPVTELYWFVDGRFVTSANPGSQVWITPSPGSHVIRVLDSTGRGDAITIQIMAPG